VLKGELGEGWRGLPQNKFDASYIDGWGASGAVLEDAILAWRLLETGGRLMFDD